MELHKDLSPVYYFSKIFGQSSYKLDKKTNTYRIDYIVLVYNSLIAFGCFYLFVTTTFELNELAEDDYYTVSKASSLLDFYSGVINQTLAICFSCFYVRKLIRLLTDLEYIDKQITQLFGPIDRTHIFKKCCWALFVLMLEFNITFWADFYFLMKSTDSKSYLFLSYIPVLATGTCKVQFYIYVQLITDRIKYLCNYLMEMEQKLNVSYAYNDRNRDLSKIFISNPNVNQFQFAIENIHKLHQKLCEAYESVNEMYGLQILLNVITVFSQNLTDLYYCYKVLTETFGKNFRNRPSCIADLFLTAQWCFVQLLEIVIMAYVCDKAHKQIANMKTRIHGLLNKTKDEDAKSTLKIFALHEMHRKFHFTAAGLFTVDFTMVQMVCGLISTYLVITVQLDMGRFSNQLNQTLGVN